MNSSSKARLAPDLPSREPPSREPAFQGIPVPENQIQSIILKGLAEAACMKHRHLDNQGFTPAAIDDIISRGKWNDWVGLRSAALIDPSLFDRIEQVCRPNIANPYAQRHHFWMNYVKEHRPATQFGSSFDRPERPEEGSHEDTGVKL